MNWTDAYFRYKMFGEIVGSAIAVVGIALIFGLKIYDAIYKARRKKRNSLRRSRRGWKHVERDD